MYLYSEFDDDGGKSSSDMSEYGSEDDVSDSLSPSSPQKPLPGRKTTTASSLNVQSPDDVGDFLGMKDYMNMMDHELSSTSVGKSFHKSSDTQKVILSLCPRYFVIVLAHTDQIGRYIISKDDGILSNQV